ncbi:hypothetical protein [Streptomyces fulvoviolaceus]|uniref:hypothetical protein n=1 Tax=Streptomyces fulvoviolaceus TaxID=285535 RepID=UPI0004C6CC42|nr:hypothetical protein [Streptomyces fulvoviolaceus]
MSPTGRRAPLPPSGYRRREIVDASGLVVRPVGQGGEDLGTYDYSVLPGSQTLRREVAGAFSRRAKAHWDSAQSCTSYDRSVRHFLRSMAAVEPPVGSLSELTPEVWKAWAEAPGGYIRAKHVGVLLQQVPGVPQAVVAQMSKRRRQVGARPKKSLSSAEMKGVRSAAAHTVRRAERRISGNHALLERWRAGELDGRPDARWGELLDHLARTGDLPRVQSGFVRNWAKVECRCRLGAWSLQLAVTRLFPSVSEKAAAAVLLICHEGWNLSVLEKLTVPSQWPNADGHDAHPAVHRVDTDKPRRARRRHSSSNLVDAGEDSTGEAMRQIISMTEQARRTLALLGRPSDLLLWSRGARHPMFSNATVGLRNAIDAWARELPDLPMGLNGRLLRHTAQVLHGRPRHNTSAVQDQHYLRRDEQVIADSREVVAAGLEDAVRHARATVRMRVITARQRDGQDDAGVIAERASLPLDVARQVVAGRLDTAVGACEDVEHSPLSGGSLCRVSFLLCFACPNALATARHLPRIVYLLQALESLRSVASAAVWKTDWEAHHRRVSDLLDQHTDPRQHPALLARLTGTERDLIDRLLERSLDS